MDSLSLSDGVTTLELIPSSPTAPGVHLGGEYDLGDPQSVTAAVRSLLVDGSSVVGRASDNRTLVLPLIVIGSTRQNLTDRENSLRALLDRQTFTLTWTPDGGLPVVFDCFRAQADVGWDERTENRAFGRTFQATFAALPFTRTPAVLNVPTSSFLTGTGWIQHDVAGIVGSARTPLNLTYQAGGSTSALLHSPPVTADPLIRKVYALAGYPFAGSADVSDHRPHGTYSVVAVIDVPGVRGVGSVHAVNVTVTEKINGHTTGTQTLSRTVRDDVGYGGYYPVGNLTLPFRKLDTTGTVTYSFSITAGATYLGASTAAHTFSQVLLLDTAGQLVMVNQNFVGDFESTWDLLRVTEPSLLQSIGDVELRLADVFKFVGADQVLISGGPFVSDPDGGPRPDGTYGPAPIFAHNAGAAIPPSVVAATYSPRWQAERSE